MEKTRQIDKGKDSTQNEEDELVSKFITSRGLRNGLTLDSPTVTIERRLESKKWYDTEQVKDYRLGFQNTNGQYRIRPTRRTETERVWDSADSVDKELSSEDVRFTVSHLEPEEKSHVPLPSNLRLLTPKTLDSPEGGERVGVIHEESGQIVSCDVQFDLRLTFKNSIGEEKTITKTFDSRSEAEQFADKLSSASEDELLDIYYDDGYKVGSQYSGFMHAFTDELLKGDSSSGLANLFMISCWMLWTAIAVDFTTILLPIFGAIILSSAGIRVGLNAKKRFDKNSYRNTYQFDDGKKRGVVIEDEEDGQVDRTVSIETEMRGDRVVLSPDELDTSWEFDVENGLISEEGVEFFDKDAGVDVLSGGPTMMRVSRTREHDSDVESVDGKWYLSRGY